MGEVVTESVAGQLEHLGFLLEIGHKGGLLFKERLVLGLVQVVNIIDLVE